MAQTVDNGTVAVALVGGGTIAPFHARHLRSSTTCTLAAIIDPFAPGQELANQLGVPHFKSVLELVSSSSCSQFALYIICVPSGVHVAVASDAVRTARPKAILLEKPLSTDAASGAALLALADRHGCQVAVGHHRRFHPAIATGQLGRLKAITGTWTSKKNDGYFSAARWRGSRARGGGPVWNNFVHDIDLLHHLVGASVSRLWATSTVSRRRPRDGPDTGDEVEEGAVMMLQFANEVVGTFVLSDNVPSPFNWEAATGENPFLCQADTAVGCFRIFGTEGTLSVPDGQIWRYARPDADPDADADGGRLEVGWNVHLTRDTLVVDDGVPFQRQVEHLARVVAGDEQPRCSGADGLAAVQVCEAVVRALDKGDGHPVDVS